MIQHRKPLVLLKRFLLNSTSRKNSQTTNGSVLYQNRSSSSNSNSGTSDNKIPDNKKTIPLCWLDLRGSGLSVLERLCLEETLLKHDDRNWMCVGTHEPAPHRYLHKVPTPSYILAPRQTQEDDMDDEMSAFENSKKNTSCCIVMGIGGKPADLLNEDQVRKDGVWVIKRFSGGGTVTVDHNSIWTTLIGRTHYIDHVEPYPRSIMAYTATILEPAWKDLRQQQLQQQANASLTSKQRSASKPTMVLDTKSCAVENTGLLIRIKDSSPHQSAETSSLNFELRENDYVLGDFKMAGNAQSIVKEGWLHHTSFLWDYHDENMEYLTLPSRRPDYRGQRSHRDFLVKLKEVLHPLKPRDFVASIQKACEQEFQVEVMTVRDAMAVVHKAFGSMDACLVKSRNRVMDLTDSTAPPATR